MTTAIDQDPALMVRLDASRTAQERSRLAFFATTIIALAMVTGAWNASLSFYRDVAFDFSNLAGDNLQGTETLQKELLTAWVHSRMINVSLLGITVGVDDASTVGAVALIVALVWFYFVIRRENHTIGRLLLDYHASAPAVRWLIFHGINSHTVFSNVGQSDEPITSVSQRPVDKEVWLLRFLSHWLYYLPFAGLSFLIALEIFSLFRVSPFRPPPEKWVITILLEKHQCWEIITIVFWRLLSVVLAIPVFYLCRRISKFDCATENVLREFVGQFEGLPENALEA